MEAVPKLPMISFELKLSPEATHFGPKLKQFIAEAYREDPDNYGNEMHQLEGLRSAAIRPTTDVAGLNAQIRYFCQLRAMQSRFPMAKGQPASVNFVWRDIFANMNCTSSDIRFELACVLYNIGALHAQLGESEPRTSADSLKSACTHFQQAAWAFQYLKEHYPQHHGVDVSPDLMRLLQEICFGQAQECILEKSIQDTKKPSVVGAVATQVMSYYKNCLAILGPSAGTDNIHEIIGTKTYNYWHRYLSFKVSYIGCIVCLYQGMNAEEQQKMGERVAFYQHAADKLAEARKLAKYIEPTKVTMEALTFTNDVVEGKKKAAKNENEFIYHEEVPDKDLLADLKPVCLVKAIPINFNDPEVSGPDIFSRLIPMGAHEASSLYSEEKAKLLRSIVDQVETKNTEIVEFLSSLQLDQLEVLDQEQSIPQEIVDKCAAMNAKTEIIQSLVDSMNNLAEMISDVETALADCKNLIQEEIAKEKDYQKVMGPRPPSIVQTELSREFNKYQEAHTRTNESNQVLHKAMTLHIANLRLLAQPLDVLTAKIPSIDNIEGLDRDKMSETRRVVGKAREMQSQRASLLHQLRADLNADDVTAALLQPADCTPEEIFKREIQKHTPKIKIIEQNLAAQENIINRLTSLYASYGESRRLLTEVLRKREGLINALITSYDAYEELLGKSQKGLEFYKKLSHNVYQLLARLRSTCQVQEEERAQLLSKQSSKTTPAPSRAPDVAVPSSSAQATTPTPGQKPTLKDYLPYMKSRGYGRNTPQAVPDVLPTEAYYPESIYPTSIRPAPLGSEATIDTPQMKYPDGYVMPPNQNPYNPYANQYGPTEANPYNPNAYGYPLATKDSYEVPKVDDSYGYTNPHTSYTPQQFTGQISNQPQSYNPYYTATQDNNTAVTDSQNSYIPVSQANMNPNTSHYNPYAATDPYAIPTTSMQGAQVSPAQEVVSAIYTGNNQSDLSMNFGQMQVGQPRADPKQENPYGSQYSNTFYSVNYPHVSTPNMSTYSHALQASNTTLVASQIPSQYDTLNYPYSHVDQTVPTNQQFGVNPTSSTYNTVDPPYSYQQPAEPLNYPNADNASLYSTATVSSNATNVAEPYAIPDTAILSQLEAIDKPIKSHTTGEALSTYPYQPNSMSYQHEQNVPQTVPPNPSLPYTDQSNSNYPQIYQNHPGYSHNSSTGNFDYNYGSQSTFSGYNNTINSGVAPQSITKDPNWASPGVYTSAGLHETVQSPSEVTQMAQTPEPNNQMYYNNPYGYQTMQPNEMVPNAQSATTNYGANLNQSTYMQSGQGNDSAVTYSNSQVSTPIDNVQVVLNTHQQPCDSVISQQNYYNSSQNYQTLPENYQTPSQTYQNVPENYQIPPDISNENVTNNLPPAQDVPETQTSATETEEIAEQKSSEPSDFDLLSEIDFTVEYAPLKPEIKVPQVSENAIKKPIFFQKEVPIPVKVEEVIERPAKAELFSDPSLLNKFTEEVNKFQRMIDSLWDFHEGIPLINSKWKTLQDLQANESSSRSKSIAMSQTIENSGKECVPYHDTRLKLKADPNAFINASYYKQLSPWCIPLVISKVPEEEDDFKVFWSAILEKKITCVLCLLSDLESQVPSRCYWPKSKDEALVLDNIKVTLDDVTSTVHWTERKLSVQSGRDSIKVTHYQICSFPSKIVAAPLVLLCDKALHLTYTNKPASQLGTAWLHCYNGASRSAVVSLLLMTMCQVRAGQINLCDMVEEGCINLFKNRTNVMQDTKDLADAYSAILFYVRGVLCSGTVAFKGELESQQIGIGGPPQPLPVAATKEKPKFSKESFEEMKQSPGLKSGDMKDPLNFLDPLWSLKKK